MRNIIKIVTFYDDGTFTESVPSVPHNPLPNQPYRNDTPWDPINAPKWPQVNNCIKCGIKLEQAMGYVCSNNPCPVGLGGVWCNVSK